MPSPRVAFALAAATLMLQGAGASADPDFKALFASAEPGKASSYACFRRVYDAAHLAAHPRQFVTTILLLGTADGATADERRINLSISASFRNRKAPLELAGDCGPPGEGGLTHCGIACDGGNIDVALKEGGSVLLTLPQGARMWPHGAGDPSQDVDNALGSDDIVFRLDRAALRDCLPLAATPQDKAILRAAR